MCSTIKLKTVIRSYAHFIRCLPFHVKALQNGEVCGSSIFLSSSESNNINEIAGALSLPPRCCFCFVKVIKNCGVQAIKAMPNLINRRKKKSKVPDVVVNDESDSDSSCSYDFSSKLNCKYNVLPEELDKAKPSKSKSVVPEDEQEAAKLLRLDCRPDCLSLFAELCCATQGR
jgi:hypothetical protein